MKNEEAIFIEKITIPNKIRQIIKLMYRFSNKERYLDNVERKAIEMYRDLDIDAFRKFSPRVLAGGLIYCAGINLGIKARLQEVADLTSCSDVSIMNIRKRIFAHLKLF